MARIDLKKPEVPSIDDYQNDMTDEEFEELWQEILEDSSCGTIYK
jgi:hypothetical protein